MVFGSVHRAVQPHRPSSRCAQHSAAQAAPFVLRSCSSVVIYDAKAAADRMVLVLQIRAMNRNWDRLHGGATLFGEQWFQALAAVDWSSLIGRQAMK